jgi:hypothetical protein
MWNPLHSVARARCGQCWHDFLIALSCKGKRVCPMPVVAVLVVIPAFSFFGDRVRNAAGSLSLSRRARARTL